MQTKGKAEIFKYILLGLVVILLLSLAALSWFFSTKSRELTVAQERIAALKKELAFNAKEVSALKEEMSKKDALIETHKTLIAALNKGNKDLEKKYSGLMKAVNEAAKSVEIYKKKADADKMLLAKYSKVFFLNENYAPVSLRYIDQSFVRSSHPLQIKTEVYPFLLAMLSDMRKDGLNPKLVSAYRSFSQQKYLKGRYLKQYGSGANKFSADQGYSEHQLGTTVDIVNDSASLTTDFDKTDEFKWLQDNAWKYGFILSYPKENTYYMYEPWHWRFVGKALAKKLHREHKYFYELSQNEIYQYLINIFDNPPDLSD